MRGPAGQHTKPDRHAARTVIATSTTTSDRYGHLYQAARDRLRDHLDDTTTPGNADRDGKGRLTAERSGPYTTGGVRVTADAP